MVIKGSKSNYYVNIQQKNTGMAILMSYKVHFKAKSITSDRGNFIIKKAISRGRHTLKFAVHLIS